jgi:hypothetical protein
VYSDPTTIRKSGNKVTMWFLFDHKKAMKSPPDPVWSEKSRYMFDCKKEQYRKLYYVLFAENMGAGRITEKGDKLQSWVPVSPDSMGKIMWQYARGK